MSNKKSNISRRNQKEEDFTDLEKIEGQSFTEMAGITRNRGAGSVAGPDFVSVGFGSMIAINRVLAVISPETAPVRRLLREARDKGLLVDATFGRKTKAVFVLDTGHILIAALQPETIIGRFEQKRTKQD